MEMCSSKTRFQSHKYVVITNLFFNAPSDLSVTREDLVSILEQLENIEKYRFQEENESNHWTKAYIKFKSRHHARQALSILQSMKYIRVELLPTILNRFTQLEDKLRPTNPNYNNDSCIMVEINFNFLYQDVLNKFSSYGRIVNTSNQNSFVAFWYRRIGEAFVAEMDNNKWNNDLNYLVVKLFEQTKELTIRLVDSMRGRDYDMNQCLKNEYDGRSAMADNFKQPFVDQLQKLINSESENVQIKISNDKTSDFQSEKHETAVTDEQNLAFNPNDYSFYLQIIRKNQIKAVSEDTDLRLSSSISVELSENELSEYAKGSNDDLALLIQDSLSTKFRNLNVEAPEYEYSKNVTNLYDDFHDSKEGLATRLCNDVYLDCLDYNQKVMQPSNLEIENSNKTENPLPFYRCGMDMSYNYSNCFYPYFDPIYRINNCICSYYRSWDTVSPWSIVPNVFIVPTTSFGHCRRNPVSKGRETQGNDDSCSSTNVPDFNETNFPPLGTNESPIPTKSSQAQLILTNKNTAETEKLNQVKPIAKKSHRKKSKKVKAGSNVRDAFYPGIEKSVKTRVRKKRSSQKSNLVAENILSTNELSEIKLRLHSCQTLNSTTSEEKHEHDKLNSKKIINLKKYKEKSIPIFSCSSNSTLNFHSSNKRWRRLKYETVHI